MAHGATRTNGYRHGLHHPVCFVRSCRPGGHGSAAPSCGPGGHGSTAPTCSLYRRITASFSSARFSASLDWCSTARCRAAQGRGTRWAGRARGTQRGAVSLAWCSIACCGAAPEQCGTAEAGRAPLTLLHRRQRLRPHSCGASALRPGCQQAADPAGPRAACAPRQPSVHCFSLLCVPGGLRPPVAPTPNLPGCTPPHEGAPRAPKAPRRPAGHGAKGSHDAEGMQLRTCSMNFSSVSSSMCCCSALNSWALRRGKGEGKSGCLCVCVCVCVGVGGGRGAGRGGEAGAAGGP